MSFTVSVYDTEVLEEKLRQGQGINLPEECRYNSEVIYQILQHGYRVLPEFSSLSDDEVRTLADSVAYMMRTDIIIPQRFSFGIMRLPEKIVPNVYDINNVYVTLRNDPDILSPEWELLYYFRDSLQEKELNECDTVACEFFRCYSAVTAWMGLRKKLDPVRRSLDPEFKLAQMTAFLLCPDNLVDYQYTPEDIEKFNNILEREILEA